MPFLLILIGAILLVAAIRNTQGDLATALEADVPPFMRWAAALGGVGALGFVPGMKEISRWLLALVLVVLVLKNYQAMLKGFTAISTATPVASADVKTPAEAYVTNPAAPAITTAQVSGTGSTANANALAQPTIANSFGTFNPGAYMTAFETLAVGFGGFA